MLLPSPLSLLPLLSLLATPSHQQSHHPQPRDLDPPFQIATAPNPSPTTSPSPLISLITRLPPCLLPCYALVAQRPPLSCDPSDLGCVCRRRGTPNSSSNNLATLSLGIAECLMVGLQAGPAGGQGQGMFAANATSTSTTSTASEEDQDGEDEDEEEEEALTCTLDDLDDLAELAGEICGMVGAGGVGRGEMEEAGGVVRGMMERAGVGLGLGPGKGEGGLGVSGGGGRAVMGGRGALVVVVGYGVLFL